jgi:4-hydroxy-tetrahydrodipicolinate reductase
MKIGVSAIKGKMSRTIAGLVMQDSIAELKSALVKKDSNIEGDDLGEFLGFNKNNIAITSNIEQFVKNCDAVIDFSTPSLSIEIAKNCAKFNKVFVCGTTGFDDKEREQLAQYSKDCVVIWSSNMSLGVNLLLNLVEIAAAKLHDDFDIEIVEMHHKNKVDSPSGTALSLGAAAAKGRSIDLEKSARMQRVGKDLSRNKNEIGFATLRGGDVVGDHKVIFAGSGERVEISHKASNRDIFAKGAIRAAIWGSAQKSGFYSMRDVLS